MVESFDAGDLPTMDVVMSDPDHPDLPMMDIVMYEPDQDAQNEIGTSCILKPPPVNKAFLIHLAGLPGPIILKLYLYV